MESLRVFFFSFILNAPYYLLCCVPFLQKLRVKKRTLVSMMLLTTFFVAVYYAVRNYLLPGKGWIDTLALLLFYVIYFLQYMKYFDISLPKLLYIFLVVQAYSNILSITAKFIDTSLYPQDAEIIAAVPYGLLVLLMLALTYPVLYRFFSGRLSKAFHDLAGSSFWLLCVTPLLFFVVNMLFTATFVRYGFSDKQIFLIYLLVLITGFITHFITLKSVMDAARGARLEADNKNMELQLALQAQNYERMMENIRQTRAARHDLRHHLAVIGAYIEQDDKAGLAGYLEVYKTSLPEEQDVPVCGNYAVDIVVRHYLAGIRQEGAVIDMQLALPCETGFSDSDLCIVFGNLFENAANSIRKQESGSKFLHARCSLREGKLVLIMDNSTGSGEKKEAGIGLSSVAAVAEKYGGGVRFEQDGNVYRSSVMLLSPTIRRNGE